MCYIHTESPHVISLRWPLLLPSAILPPPSSPLLPFLLPLLLLHPQILWGFFSHSETQWLRFFCNIWKREVWESFQVPTTPPPRPPPPPPPPEVHQKKKPAFDTHLTLINTDPASGSASILSTVPTSAKLLFSHPVLSWNCFCFMDSEPFTNILLHSSRFKF